MNDQEIQEILDKGHELSEALMQSETRKATTAVDLQKRMYSLAVASQNILAHVALNEEMHNGKDPGDVIDSFCEEMKTFLINAKGTQRIDSQPIGEGLDS